MGIQVSHKIRKIRNIFKCIFFKDDCKTRWCIPALPFSRRYESVRKPLGIKYMECPVTIGEKMRNRRLELGLLQKDVAVVFEVSEDCIVNWENNRFEPQIRYAPKVIEFLGYNPYSDEVASLGDRIKQYRKEQGLSHKKMGKLLGVDASTIGAWEKTKNLPHHKTLMQLNKLIDQ